MLVKHAHHVSLSVADIDASRRFYGDLLGLPEIERPDFGFPGAWYQAGAVQIHLIVPAPGVEIGSPPPKLNPMAPHLAFEIEDYESVRASLGEQGIELLEAGKRVGQFWAQDPDGNVIEFIQPGGQLGRVPRSAE